MSNINNLTSKILKDAEERKDSILAEAEKEKAKILERKNKEAKTLEAEMLDKARIEAQTRKERVISGAELTARNEKLKAKQAIIKEVFNMSIDELCKLNEDQYLAFIKDNILSLDIDGDEILLLNEEGKKLVDANLLSEINKEFASKGKKGEIKIAECTADFKGGFILEKNGVEINNTFEALVNSLKEELEFEVARELFN